MFMQREDYGEAVSEEVGMMGPHFALNTLF